MSNFNLTITDKNGRVHRPLVRGIRFSKKYIGGIDDWLTFYLDRRLNRDWGDIDYDNKVILYHGIIPIWQGRIRQIAEDQSGRENLFILALGYAHYLKDYTYGGKGKLWIDTRLDRVKPVTSDDWSRALDISYDFTISGKEGLVYITPKNLSYSSSNEIGAVTYWSYIDTIKRVEFDYELVIPDDPWGVRVGNDGTWAAGLYSFNIDWTGITEEQIWYDDASGHADITLSPDRERIAFGLFYNRDNTADIDIAQFVEYPGTPKDPVPISQADMESDDWIDVVKANDVFDQINITMGTNKNATGSELRTQYLSERLAGSGYGWVDLPIFRDGTSTEEGTTNLVPNGDMEDPSGWNGYNSPSVNEQSTEQVYEGDYSRKFTATGDWQGIRNNGAPWTTTTGQGYTLRFAVYPDDDTSVRIRLRKGDDSGELWQEEVTGLTQDAWQLIERHYVETAGGSGAYITFESGNAGSGTWYIDDVDVVTSAAPFAQSGIIDLDSPPVDWAARTPTLQRHSNYWVRIRPKDDLDSIDIDAITVNLGVRRVVEDTVYVKITNLKIYGVNGTTVVQDYFIDTDGTSLSDHEPDYDVVGGGWYEPEGTWEIQSNVAATPYGNPRELLLIDMGNSDGIMEGNVLIGTAGNNDRAGIVFRAKDDDNHWSLELKDETLPEDRYLELWLREGAVDTLIDYVQFGFDRTKWYTLKAVFNGADIDCYVDGVLKLSVTNSTHINETKVGFIAYHCVSCRFDFEAQELGPTPITPKLVFRDITKQLSDESRCDISSSVSLIDPNSILTKVYSQLVFERGETCYQAAGGLQTIGDEDNRSIAWGVENAGDRVFLHPLSDAATEPWRSYRVRYVIFPEESERLQIEGQVQDIVTYAYGRYEDIDGIEKLTSGYIAYMDEALGTYGLRAALLNPPTGKKSAEEFFNIKRVSVILCGKTVLTGAEEIVKSTLINQGRPKLRSSVATRGKVIDRKMGTKMIPAFWLEPGYPVQIARFRAIDAEGASGDILDDWATTFLLAGIEYDCETGICTLIPMEPELTSSRLLSR